MEKTIKNRRLDHIGLACCDVEAAKDWYVSVLGFEVIGAFPHGEHNVYFVKNGTTVYEMYQSDTLSADARGKIDHIAYESDDIEADYAYCVREGYTITTDGVQGCRFSKIASPTGEQIEFAHKN